MNTLWSSQDKLMINPPNWEAALHFLETFTHLDDEFSRIELANTGMFDLSHAETAEKLDLEGAVRAIKLKSRLAKEIVQWIAENEHLLDGE
ncbi:MAG: hypothetical protein AAFR42_02970 [Cyanobacteria bacterium J06628_6]